MLNIPISQVRKKLYQIVNPLFTTTFAKIYESTVKEVAEADIADIILNQAAEIDMLITDMTAATNVFELNNLYKSQNKLTILALYLRYHYCINFLVSAKQERRITVPEGDQEFLHFMLFEFMESEALARNA